jgi:hypothetical protein
VQAYLDLPHRGLVTLRAHAQSGNLELSRIEADHLHNIPTLLDEDNEHRHVYYIQSERGLYLQRLRQLGATEDLEQARIWYAGPWMVLAEAASVTLPTWDHDAKPSSSTRNQNAAEGPRASRN